MSFSDRWQEIRTGFERPFWVANISEIFERLSYYARLLLARRLSPRKPHFSTEQTGTLTGIFGGMVWFLAIFGGALADRLGFRRALSLAYLILAAAYFLLGSVGAAVARARSPRRPARSVRRRHSRSSRARHLHRKAQRRRHRRACFKAQRPQHGLYDLLHAGQYRRRRRTIRRQLAHKHSASNMSSASPRSASCDVFRRPAFFPRTKAIHRHPAPSIAPTLREIFSSCLQSALHAFPDYFFRLLDRLLAAVHRLPLFIHGYIDPNADVEWILITDAFCVICFQVIITHITRKIPSFRAITIGTLISSCSWLVVASKPAIWACFVSLAILALGEMVLSPRYYEYVSRLAPPGQQGTYMGFAFVPIGIGSLVGGPLAGVMMHHFAEVQHRPYIVWWFFSGFGICCAALLWIYDLIVKPGAAPAK